MLIRLTALLAALLIPALAAAQGVERSDAVRLLRQASFGPTEAEIQRVMAIGPAAWVDEQLALPVGTYPAYPYVPAARPQSCVDVRTPPITTTSFCARDNYTIFQLQLAFFRDAIGAPDQLRQRVAFALSQILVTSGVDISRNYAMRHYQQILRDHAFGSYRELLQAVTLSPAMGEYLDMVNNSKANLLTGTEPNENYAREILQLFSIGTVWLNPDGTPVRDAAGELIPTYEQEEIVGFAHVFTGWTYPTIPGQRPRNLNPRNYEGAMLAVAANHDFGAKQLLSGVVAPASLPMEADLAYALDNISTHPNVGPFIGRQLIQKLVTSDPTPAYVARISAVFADDGAGRRGKLAAVVRAILLDPEARGARSQESNFGKLDEPILYLSSVVRGLGGRSDGVYLRLAAAALSQSVFAAPSVFNFYPAGYRIAGGLPAPEFGIQTTATAINRANIAYGLIFSNGIAPDPMVFGATGTAVNLAPYQSVAGDAAALVGRLEANLLAVPLPAAARSAVIGAVNAVPASDRLNRARTAAYLVVTSPHFQVER